MGSVKESVLGGVAWLRPDQQVEEPSLVLVVDWHVHLPRQRAVGVPGLLSTVVPRSPRVLDLVLVPPVWAHTPLSGLCPWPTSGLSWALTGPAPSQRLSLLSSHSTEPSAVRFRRTLPQASSSHQYPDPTSPKQTFRKTGGISLSPVQLYGRFIVWLLCSKAKSPFEVLTRPVFCEAQGYGDEIHLCLQTHIQAQPHKCVRTQIHMPGHACTHTITHTDPTLEDFTVLQDC